MARMLGRDFKSSSTKGLGWQSPHDDDDLSRCSGALPLFLSRCLLAAYATRCVLVMGNLASVKFRGHQTSWGGLGSVLLSTTVAAFQCHMIVFL